MNSTHNATNLYPMIGGATVPPSSTVSVSDSLHPYCNYQIDDAVLQHGPKSMNASLPLPRKRPRDSPTGKLSAFSFLGEDLSLEMTQHQLEVDRLISLHMEKVRREIEERRRDQCGRIIRSVQVALARQLRDKEEQIEKIGKQNYALEERVRSLYLENQIWRDLAQTNEATANALRSNLEQVLSQANNNINKDFRICTAPAENADAESCCGSSGEEEGGEEVDRGQVLKWRKVGGGGGERKEAEEERRRMCRRCGTRESSVLLLPCRHLCMCTACGSVVDTCPVCHSASDATVHVNLS